MKTLTELSPIKIRLVQEKKQELTTTGKTAEEMPAALAEATQLDAEKLVHFEAALALANGKLNGLKRVVVIQLGEGEKAPGDARAHGSFHYVIEYFQQAQKPRADQDSRDGRRDGGRRGGKRGDKGRSGDKRGGARGSDRNAEPSGERSERAAGDRSDRPRGRRPEAGDRPRIQTADQAAAGAQGPSSTDRKPRRAPRPRPAQAPRAPRTAADLALNAPLRDGEPTPTDKLIPFKSASPQ